MESRFLAKWTVLSKFDKGERSSCRLTSLTIMLWYHTVATGNGFMLLPYHLVGNFKHELDCFTVSGTVTPTRPFLKLKLALDKWQSSHKLYNHAAVHLAF